MTSFNKMPSLPSAAGFVAALGVTLASNQVLAQTAALIRHLCVPLGSPSQWEPIGDREAHNILTSRLSCRVEGGPLEGGATFSNAMWEYDRTTGTLLSGDGVVRKPGAMVAFRFTAGTVTLTMKDGNLAGWTASGKGVYTMATGAAASLGGKTFSWTARPTGVGQQVSEWVMD